MIAHKTQQRAKGMRALLRWMVSLTLFVGLHAFAQSTGTVTYVYTDQQGTPLAETDANGNITATFEYTPYGTFAPTGTSNPGPDPKGPGYTGHVSDPETNLVYMQARYYDPATGRFLSADPEAASAGNTFNFNRYAYANNNPVINVDPDGRSALEQDLLGRSFTQDNFGHRNYCYFCLETTGQLIDREAQESSDAGNHVATYGWAFLGEAWKYLGAESVSQVADKGSEASGADKFMAAVTIVTLGKGPEIAEAAEVIRGGAAAVRVGKEGETAVRALVDIGPKQIIKIGARDRIPDGLTRTVLSEVKNVRALSYTQQLRDYAAFAKATGRQFDLYVRPTTKLSGPLTDAVSSGAINLKYIPTK